MAQQATAALVAQPVSLPDMALGSDNAPVTITEYSSMSCPHCAAFGENVFPMLRTKYIDTGKVRFVFREFPLDIKAAAASMLARCVANGDAEKFFGTVQLLFQQQQQLMQQTTMTLRVIGKQAGMSEPAVETCVRDQTLLDKLAADQRFAHRGHQGGFDADVFRQWRTAQGRHVVRGAGRENQVAAEEVAAAGILPAVVSPDCRVALLLFCTAPSPMMAPTRTYWGRASWRPFCADFSQPRCCCPVVAAIFGAGLSEPAGARGGRVSSGRSDRRHRAYRGAEALRQSRPAVLCREHRRRGRQHRGRPGRARHPRRLHHHGDQHRLRGEPQPLCQGAVRSGEGFYRRFTGRGFAKCRGGQSRRCRPRRCRNWCS